MNDGNEADLAIALETVCGLIDLATDFAAKSAASDEESGSNPGDDRMVDVLEDTGEDAVEARLRSLIDDLAEDEQVDLVALMWLGRGDETAADWGALRVEAARAHTDFTAEYLLGTMLFGSYLEEGLAKLGLSSRDHE